MTCATPACGAEALDVRQGGVHEVVFLAGTGRAGECQIIQRRVIWLCDACTGLLAVETGRPREEHKRPPRSFEGERRQPMKQSALRKGWN